jgi:CheY-like chemotaxis protein
MIQNPSVLYVEDDLRSQKVMELTLRSKMNLSYVNLFSDSANIVERVQALKPQPDIVFLDIHMEPHSGFQVLEMLRKIDQYKKTPVVALTASVMNEEVAMMRTAGFDGCLAKPIDLETFEDSFKRILSGEQVWRIT